MNYMRTSDLIGTPRGGSSVFVSRAFANAVAAILISLGTLVFAEKTDRGGQYLLSSDFQQGIDPGLKSLGGRWEVRRGALVQLDPDSLALLVADHPEWNHYRVRVKIRFESDAADAEAGIAYAYYDSTNYHLFCLSHRKSGWYVVQRTHRDDPAVIEILKAPTDWPFLNYPAMQELPALTGDMAEVKIDTKHWHELQVDFSDGRAMCFLDGKHVTDFTFTSKLPAWHPHQPMWKSDLDRGGVGLFTRRATAMFDDWSVARLKSASHIITPQNPQRAESGVLIPRMRLGEIVENSIRWTLGQKEILDVADHIMQRGKALTAEQLNEFKHWDPYLLTSHTTADDRGLTDLQYPAHNHPYMIFSLIRSYAYNGDTRLLDLAREYGEWNLQHCWPEGTAAAGLALSLFDFRASARETNWAAAEVEPDKSTAMGRAYLQLHAVSGDEKYLRAAERLAAVLIKLQYPQGNWPFRIRAGDGAILAPYTANNLWYVQFFEQLHTVTGKDEYKRIADKAFAWLMANPVKTGRWAGFYGDMGPDSIDQWIPTETALYLLERDAANPEFRDVARGLLELVIREHLVTPGFAADVPAIVEQSRYKIILSHHNLRLAALYAELSRATGEEAYRRAALQLAHSVSLLVMHDGKMLQTLHWWHAIFCAPPTYSNSEWLRIMACLPETAPRDENHLLKYTGLLRRIRYEVDRIQYEFAVPGSTDFLVMARAPRAIHVDGRDLESSEGALAWNYDPTNHLLEIHHAGTHVEIR